MDIKIEVENGFDVVMIGGRIDAVTSPELEGALLDLMNKGTTHIIIDLNDVTYLSSAGLRVILMVTEMLYGKGNVIVSRPQSDIREILEVTGFDTIMPICDELEMAKQELLAQ